MTISLSIRKKAGIAEIYGMMEKADKDKYWVLEQIERISLKVKVTPAMSTFEILDACPASFITKLENMLRQLSPPAQELPKYTNTYHWFFTDIVAGANPDIATDGQTVDLSASWTPQGAGTYTIKVFIWDGFDNPSPLSEGLTTNLDAA